MAYYNYSPNNSSNPSQTGIPSSNSPIPLDTFSGSRPRPTIIPFKQFGKPRSNSLLEREREDRERRKAEEDLDDSGVGYSPDSDYLEPGAPTSGRGEASGHRRRRSTLMGDVNNGPRTHTSTRHDRKEGISESDEEQADENRRAESDEDGLQDDEETGLTGGDRKKRGGKKRRNTLDQRIAKDDGMGGTSKGISSEEKKEADKNVVRDLCVNGLLIGLWYLFSLSISIYNKWMFSPDHLDFHFPLFTTCMHMLVQFSLAALVLFFFPRFRPRHDSISNPYQTLHMSEGERSRHEIDSRKPLMTRWFYATRLGPCGLATGLDIGLGNMSLKFITLTFYTMVKSSALAFVLLFAFLFRLETPSLRLVLIIATMTVGVILMVSGETSFNALGFVLILSAAFFSGFRWGLTQILLLRNPATSNPFSSIFYLAPIMFVSLFCIAIPVEGFGPLADGLAALVEKQGAIQGPLVLLSPGLIAFCMTSSEFALLQRTSVVTLSIAGIFKEVVTISAAALVFGDTMSPINVSGLFVTIGAIAAYNYLKIMSMRENARMELVGRKSGDSRPVYVEEADDEESDENYGSNESEFGVKRPGVGRKPSRPDRI